MMGRRAFLALGAAPLFLAGCSGKRRAGKAVTMGTGGGIEWHVDESTGARWCVGVPYCKKPVDIAYQTLAVLAPGSLTGDPWAADNAPLVMPVVTGGYAAMKSPTEADIPGLLEEARPFLDAGMVYVRTGCRGREHGAPAGVTDLKATVRWLRAHDDEVPGDKDRLFAFGHSGGGAQAALLGASGNGGLWAPDLEAIGAEPVSDAIAGAMCWCPVTSLGVADAAYEWGMGRFCREGADLEQSLDLAASYPGYLQKLGYDEDEYNELLLDVATRSLRDWLEDHPDKALDVNWDWIDSTVNGEPRVRDLASFVRNRKRPDKPVPAFDRNDLGSPENLLFGHDGVPLHFDDSFVDVFGRRQAERIAMYDPLTYLLDEEAGVDVAPHWRISSGIMQPDTALSTEVNLAVAARRCLGVQDVAFQTVWDRAHVMAERSGAPEQNVIEWIGCCLG